MTILMFLKSLLMSFTKFFKLNSINTELRRFYFSVISFYNKCQRNSTEIELPPNSRHFNEYPSLQFKQMDRSTDNLSRQIEVFCGTDWLDHI